MGTGLNGVLAEPESNMRRVSSVLHVVFCLFVVQVMSFLRTPLLVLVALLSVMLTDNNAASCEMKRNLSRLLIYTMKLDMNKWACFGSRVSNQYNKDACLLQSFLLLRSLSNRGITDETLAEELQTSVSGCQSAPTEL